MSLTNSASHAQSDQGARLASAVERVIRPFIKLIVGRVSCGFLIQQIKRIYIEEARRWIEKNDPQGRVTKSKLAMLTGLDTRTISSIETQSSDPSQCTIGEICPEAAVLYCWTSQLGFRNQDDEIIDLRVTGRTNSFQSLVSSTIGRNVTYQTVLEPLLESGNVQLVDDDFVRLVDPYYQPVKASDQTIIDAGSASIGRMSETVLHNMQSAEKEQRLLQQNRWSRRIPSASLPELRLKSREIIERQMLEIESLIDSYEVDEDSPGTCVFGVGWFQFQKQSAND